MKRLFIRRSEIMQITGWGKTKAGEICALIRVAFNYPSFRNDIIVKDFCNYMELDEDYVQSCLNTSSDNQNTNNLPKTTKNTALNPNNNRDLQGNSS